MKRLSPIKLLLLLLICSTLSLSCHNSSSTPIPVTDQPVQQSNNSDGFADDHKLQGRYINTDNGIRSFTFKTDGTFAKGGAVSGDFNGGDYVAGTHDEGTYNLSGKILKVTYSNGDSENLDIEIFSYNDQNDYSQASPSRLKINHVTYSNDD